MRAGRERAILSVPMALVLALAFWLVMFGAAGAASGTPWHTQADSLSGVVLLNWQVWSRAFAAETWSGDAQTWQTSDLPWLVALHPTTANAALAAHAQGVFRTTDGGVTWTKLPGIVDPVLALAHNTQSASIVYAGTELAGTYRSADNGLYWRSIDNGMPRDRLGRVAGAVALAADPILANTLFAATTTAGGLYRSRDDGATWSLANSGLPAESILGLAVTHSGQSRLYAALTSGLYLSNDRAETWTPVGSLPTESPLELLLEPDSQSTLLLVAEDALYRSTNGGVTWIDLDLPAEMTPISDALYTADTDFTYLFVAGAGETYWQRITPVSPVSPPQTELDTESYATITGHTIRGGFLAYYNENGGLGRFGYPRTDAVTQDGVTVQYFQRGRLETVVEDETERVAQSPLGALLREATSPGAMQSSGDSDQTQYAVDQVFASFYVSNNGQEAFGAPLGPAADEEQVNGGTLYTQYFEFARLEHHPGAESPVLLGLIGDEYLAEIGWLE